MGLSASVSLILTLLRILSLLNLIHSLPYSSKKNTYRTHGIGTVVILEDTKPNVSRNLLAHAVKRMFLWSTLNVK